MYSTNSKSYKLRNLVNSLNHSEHFKIIELTLLIQKYRQNNILKKIFVQLIS